MLRARSKRFQALLLCPALLALACSGPESEQAPPGPTLRANIVLVTLHAMRPDRMSIFGWKNPTTPELMKLRAQSQIYTHTYATSNWTLPSHASLFTGTYPRTHGARFNPEGSASLADVLVGPSAYQELRAEPLSDALPTLAERLSSAGYTTAGIVSLPWHKKRFGLSRGFAHWDDEAIIPVDGRRAEQVSRAALRWLEDAPESPFFLFLTYGDANLPYQPPDGSAQRFIDGALKGKSTATARIQRAAGAYESEVAYVDRELARVFDALRKQGLFEESLIIVTGDHGELLGEKNKLTHGQTLYEAELRVPLILKWPASFERRGFENAKRSNCALFATILETIGEEVPPEVQCPSLSRKATPVFAEAVDRTRAPGLDWEVWLDGEQKLHRNSRGKRLRVYDLGQDPAEEAELDDAATLERLKGALESFTAKLPVADSEAALLGPSD